MGCVFPPNVYNFNILMHNFCKDGKIREAQSNFDEIGKWGLIPSVVSFNTLINGYCRLGDLEEGFRLKTVMEESHVSPDVFSYSVLINVLCKDGRLDDANQLFDEMCESGLVPMLLLLLRLMGIAGVGNLSTNVEEIFSFFLKNFNFSC